MTYIHWLIITFFVVTYVALGIGLTVGNMKETIITTLAEKEFMPIVGLIGAFTACCLVMPAYLAIHIIKNLKSIIAD